MKMTLKAARTNVGYTQQKVSEILGISNKTLCAWENGKTMPNVKMINALCELYGLSYDNIVFLPENKL